MKLLSGLLAVALLAVSVPASASPRFHRAGVSSSFSSLVRRQHELESLVSRVERLASRLEEQLEVEREEEESPANGIESQFVESSTEDAAEIDSADIAASTDPTLATWSKFTHTWGNPLTSTPGKTAWFPVGLTSILQANQYGFLQDSKPCDGGSAKGFRYHPPTSDPNVDALWFLYGANGQLAGLQSVVTINPGPNNISPAGPYQQETGVNGEDVWTIAAYFRNPTDDSICDPNTPVSGPVGDGLWLAYTGDAATAESVPLSITPSQAEITVATPGQRSFTVGGCMDTMGVHYWREKLSDKAGSNPANALDPYFLLYHPKTNQLVGFGFLELLGVATKYQTGNYWEQVPVVSAPIFMKPSQISLDLIEGAIDPRRQLKLQSQHYYFIDNPLKQISCIPFLPSPIPPSNA